MLGLSFPMENKPQHHKSPGSECLMKGADARDIIDLPADDCGRLLNTYPVASYSWSYGVQHEMMPTIKCTTIVASPISSPGVQAADQPFGESSLITPMVAIKASRR